MSVPYEGRGEWTDRSASSVARQIGKRLGVAVHWPGFHFDLGSHADCLRLVARLERESLPRGYAAIPYNELACPHGKRVEGRGIGRRSAANGSNVANDRYGSVCALLPIGGKPSSAMLNAIRASLTAQAPGGKLVTHNQVRPEPTACPGPELTAWIGRGAPAPVVPRRTHVVKKGETLWAIARRYYGGDGEQWHRIAAANRLTDADELAPGRKLVIP